MPIANSIFLRPNMSVSLPAHRAPTMVPISAIATVKPRPLLERWKTSFSASVVPEITAVSNPKISPPSEATIALRTTSGFIRKTLDAKSELVHKIARFLE